MARPSNLPGTGWATNASRRTALSSAQWGTGFVAGQPVVATDVNDAIGQVSDWAYYLQTMSPTEGVWTVINSGTTYGTLGYSTTSGSWLYLASNSARDGVLIDAVDGTAANTLRLRMANNTGFIEFVMDPTGADTILLRVGANGLVGPTSVVSASTGFRWGYPAASPLVCILDVSPGTNGYTFALQPGVTVNLNSGVFWVSNNSGGADGFISVLGLGLLGVAAHIAAPVQAVSLAGSFTSLGNTNVICRLIERVRSTGATNVLLTIESTAASVTDNNGGTPIDLDPYTNQYYVEVLSNGNIPDTGTSDQIELLTLTLNKFAVE